MARVPTSVGHREEALPAADVARAGGWANAGTLQACYQLADPATMLRVVMELAALREVRG